MAKEWWRGNLAPREFALSVAGLATYSVLLVGGRLVVQANDPAWQRGLLAALIIAVALATVGVLFRSARRTREVDRAVVAEATSWSFFATMAAVLTYGLLESFTNAPRLSMWSVWMFGMTGWALSSVLFRRKLY